NAARVSRLGRQQRRGYCCSPRQIPQPPADRTMSIPVILGITGASGAAYAKRVIELLAAAEVEIHLAVSALGRRLLFDELGMKRIDADALTGGRPQRLIVHNDNDVGATIASGS